MRVVSRASLSNATRCAHNSTVWTMGGGRTRFDRARVGTLMAPRQRGDDGAIRRVPAANRPIPPLHSGQQCDRLLGGRAHVVVAQAHAKVQSAVGRPCRQVVIFSIRRGRFPLGAAVERNVALHAGRKSPHWASPNAYASAASAARSVTNSASSSNTASSAPVAVADGRSTR